MAKTTSKGTGGKFPQGGSTKMFGKQSAGPMKPGVTAGKSGTGGKFPVGLRQRIQRRIMRIIECKLLLAHLLPFI